MSQNNNVYSHIVIIGNGFDLNQGFKSSYIDFLKSDFFKKLLKDKNYLAEYFLNRHSLKNWIDIENELTNYSKNLNDFQYEKNFESDFDSIKNALKEYLLSIHLSDYKKEKQSYKLIEYLIGKNFLIFDFNYTLTIQEILVGFGLSDKEIEKRHIKMHGSIHEKEIIFGVEDSANIKKEHVFLRKAFNRTFKAINIENSMKQFDELIIFGHSLGETDHMYFKDFFFNSSYNNYELGGKKITLFYYGQESYKNLFKQLDEMTHNKLTGLKQFNTIITIDTLTQDIANPSLANS